MRKLIKGVPQLSASRIEPFECAQYAGNSPLRTKWGGKNELALKSKISNLEQRVNDLEAIIIDMNLPWYKRIWK